MKRVWKKPRRLHGVCDERSGKAVDGDGGRYRRACVPGTGGRAPFNGPGLAGSLAGYRRSYGSGFSAEKRHRRPISTHKATGANQVWMWDITYLNGPIKGKHYYLYVFSDLCSRKIVGWEVWESEEAKHASELVK